MRHWPSRNCEKCGKEYQGYGERFCSPVCAHNVKRENKLCEVCKISFYPDHHTVKYCSRKCWMVAVHVAARPKKRYRRNCNNCGKYYEGEGRLFCSLVCAGKSMSEQAHKLFKRHHGVDIDSVLRKPLIKRKHSTLVHRARQMKLAYPTRIAFTSWYIQTPKICHYCDIPEEIWETLYYGKQYKFSLSIDRKDNAAGYEIWNMVLACHICNVVKNQFLTELEMRDVAQRYLKPKWQAKIKEGVKENEASSVVLE